MIHQSVNEISIRNLISVLVRKPCSTFHCLQTLFIFTFVYICFILNSLVQWYSAFVITQPCMTVNLILTHKKQQKSMSIAAFSNGPIHFAAYIYNHDFNLHFGLRENI